MSKKKGVGIFYAKKYGATARFHRIFGRGDGDRTHDLSVPNAARYQLRYASILRLQKRIYSTNAYIITN